MTRVATGAAAIEWNTPPPPKASRSDYGGLKSGELVAIAESRPGVWASYDTGDVRRACVYSMRMRDAGVEAVARETVIYFRGGQR